MQDLVKHFNEHMTDTRLTSVTKADDVVADCLDDGLEIMASRKPEQHSATAMVSERERLRTFQNGWPLHAKAKPEDLAKHGFYYTREGDRVRCAFCGLEIENWTREMAADVYLAHWKSANTYCRFLQGHSVGNMAIQDEVNFEQRSRDIEELRRVLARALPATNRHRMAENFQGAVPSGNHEITVNTQVLAALNSSRPEHAQPSAARQRARRGDHSSNNKVWTELVRTAQYPHMASLQARLATFSRWPLMRPSPREMAKAGLFCATSTRARATRGEAWSWPQTIVCADSVKCFWCGERLHRWRSTDDAVLEHARLSPHCRFVRQLLGDALHHDVVRSTTETQRVPVVEQPTTTISTQTSEEHGQDDVMNTPAVRTVLQMGFPPQLIRNILGHNSPLLDAETLCSLALQAAHAQSSSQTPEDDLVERTVTRVMNCQGQEVATHGNELTTQTQKHTGKSQDLTPHAQKPEPCHGMTSPGQGQGKGQAVDDILQEMGKKYSTFSHLTSRMSPASPSHENVETGSSGGRLLCKLCQDQEVKVTFRPCGHLVCCLDCSQRLTICPVCQKPFTDKIVTYLA